MRPSEADRRGFAVLGWVVLLLVAAGLLQGALGIKYVGEVEWPTDLFALSHTRHPAPADVGIAGSSRSHYAFAPRLIDACLSDRLGRPTRTESASRLAASTYATDLLARDLFSGERRPRVLVAEVAPDSLNAAHFELNHNVGTSADPGDVPECLLAAAQGPPDVAACARPLFRGVESLAFLLHRPWTDHAHITWMALYEGGGQYCASHPSCEARNADYDRRHAGRWQTRIERVLPHVRAERFADYRIEGGLPASHFEALLRRAEAEGLPLFIVNLPVSATYQAEIPPEDYATFDRYVRATTAAHGARYLDWNSTDWNGGDWTARALYIDPDHLNSIGARRASTALCEALVDALH